MQQVVDLQRDKAFDDLGVQMLAISPDPVSAWEQEAVPWASRSHAVRSGEHRVDEVRDAGLDDGHERARPHVLTSWWAPTARSPSSATTSRSIAG
jgi:hypothetical protein